jgi:membrane protein DedA with SNARE-associated domain
MDTETIQNIALIVWLIFWGYTIYFCRKVAGKLNYRKDVALLVSFLFPIPALILYAVYLFKAKLRAKKV